MKKLNLLILSVAAGALIPATTQAGVLNSPHDFSTASWNTAAANPSDPNSVCGPCHQAHHADSSIVPLWVHDTVQGVWKMYNTANVPTSQMQATVDAKPAGPSLACLSCHDGTVAVNQIGGKVLGGVPVKITNSARITTDAAGNWTPGDLTHSHPISFVYDASLAGKDLGLFNPDTKDVLVPDNSPFNVGNGATDKRVVNFLLSGTHRLECTSCHDVHNQKGSPFNIQQNPKLLVIAGSQGGKGSLLCRSCHNK